VCTGEEPRAVLTLLSLAFPDNGFLRGVLLPKNIAGDGRKGEAVTLPVVPRNTKCLPLIPPFFFHGYLRCCTGTKRFTECTLQFCHMSPNRRGARNSIGNTIIRVLCNAFSSPEDWFVAPVLAGTGRHFKPSLNFRSTLRRGFSIPHWAQETIVMIHA
jgi:hypothetical protein